MVSKLIRGVAYGGTQLKSFTLMCYTLTRWIDMCHHGYRITGDERELEELLMDVPEEESEQERPEEEHIPPADD